MPITISVKSNLDVIKRMFRQYPAQVKSANRLAMNRAVSHSKVLAKQHIKRERTLSATEIASKIKTRNADYSHARASIVFNANAIPLEHFKHRFSRRQGFSVTVFANGTPKVVSQFGNKAFQNLGSKLNSAVFVRTTSARSPIRKLYGPSVGSAITARGYDSELRSQMAETWSTRIVHELTRMLDTSSS